MSPDLSLVEGHQFRKAPSKDDSIFHFAFADTEPVGWGCRLELAHLLSATRAVEMNKETEADLKYLRGHGTSLGGMRPKCTILDEDGHLAIGKFPSVKDDRSVTRGEVLALHLAAAAGITVSDSRIVMSDSIPVAVVRRFDRAKGGGRIPYLSAGSMLQASRADDHAYTQIADVIKARCVDPANDLEELWRRLAFNLLITNVDDHVQNHGFLHVEHGQWRLAPAFDINPFPDKDPELKLWLTGDSGPVDSIKDVMLAASYFWLSEANAKRVLDVNLKLGKHEMGRSYSGDIAGDGAERLSSRHGLKANSG